MKKVCNAYLGNEFKLPENNDKTNKHVVIRKYIPIRFRLYGIG